MTWPLLIALTGIYALGKFWTSWRNWSLRSFVWGAFGQAFLILQLGLLINLPETLAGLEAQHLQTLAGWMGINLQVFEATSLLVPDGQGWTSMTIGIESSTFIEMAVFSGLIMHYPGMTWQRRITSLGIGILLTYALNLLRLAIIILIVTIWGRSSFIIAHTVIGRIIYFMGIVALYWYLLTIPTVTRVQQAVAEREA